MLLFDWKKIYDATDGDSVDIVRVLRMLTERRVPNNKYDKLFYLAKFDYSGDSFMVHPELLLYNSHLHTHKELATYAAFAALRPLADYKAYGEIRLNPLHVPEELLPFVEGNSLLELDEDEMINFVYERSPTKMEIH